MAIAPGYDKQEAREMLALCAFVETGAVQPPIPDPRPGWSLLFDSPVIDPFENKWQLWQRAADKRFAIALRGTVAKAGSILEDMIAMMVKAEGALSVGDISCTYKFAGDLEAGIHFGFASGTLLLLTDLANGILVQLRGLGVQAGSELYITGHSQGAAMATLLRSYLEYTGGVPAGCSMKTYVFAQPKPGNQHYADDFEARFCNAGMAFRVTNPLDWVPQVPFTLQFVSDIDKPNPLSVIASPSLLIALIEKALAEVQGAVLAQMESGNSLSNVVILDACRNNPLASSLANSYGPSRSAEVGRGLSMTLSRVGTMIVYSTQPDNVALDGAGRNSPFTAALLKHIRTPGIDISLLMRRVRVDVVAATDSRQVPWDHSSLMGEVVLASLPQETQVASIAPSPASTPAPPAPTAAVSLQPPRQSRLRSTNEFCANSANAVGVNRYCASSMLPPQSGINYGVENLFSPDPLTAWIEGVPGLGVGEWISVDFDRSRLVRSIALQNGYQKSPDIFNKNARVQRLKLIFSEGESLSIKLEDRMGWQKIDLNRPIKADWIQFVIEDVYPGSRYTDTAISKLSVASERAQ